MTRIKIGEEVRLRLARIHIEIIVSSQLRYLNANEEANLPRPLESGWQDDHSAPHTPLAYPKMKRRKVQSYDDGSTYRWGILLSFLRNHMHISIFTSHFNTSARFGCYVRKDAVILYATTHDSRG